MKKNKQPTEMRIMFAGASGTGKTTLAKYIQETLGCYADNPIPFISGSVSDLLPQTKDIPHAEMLSRDSESLAREDYQIISLRKKNYQPFVNEHRNFVTDRSYLDSAAYFLYKQADKIPSCEVEHFLQLCLMCLTQQCTHLFFIPFTKDMFKSWVTEDNGKRITSKYFQMEISYIMKMVLDMWDATINHHLLSTGGIWFDVKSYDNGMRYGEVTSPYGTTKVFILEETELVKRQELIQYVLTR